MARHAEAMPDERTADDQTALSLTTGGITLLGVLVSVGFSVAMGISASWWVRVLAGAGTVVALVVLVKAGTKAGRGPLSRLARWTIGYEEPSDSMRSRRSSSK